MSKSTDYNFDNSKLIFFERVCLLHEQLTTVIPIAFVCATILFFSLYGSVNSTLLVTWYVMAVAIFVARLIGYIFYKKTPYLSRLHLILFSIGTTLTAVIWAITGTLLMPNNILLQTVNIIVIAGVVAGGIQSIQASRLASIVYIIIALVPMSAWLVMRGETSYYLIGAAVFAYVLFMLGTSRRGNHIIMDTFKLRYENTAINAQLSQTNKLLNEEIVKHQVHEKSLAQLAEIVNNSKDAIIGLDNSGIIQTWNKGAENLYGYSSQEVTGHDLSIITPESQRDILNSMLEQVKNNLSFQNIELQRYDKYHQQICVAVTMSPIRNPEGKIIGISTIDRDIRERKEIDRVKNEFISIVSHELRTPLTSIKGSIGLLIYKPQFMPNIKQNQLLEIAYNNCDRLVRLINDILDIEKIESGNLTFIYKSVNLLNIIKEAIKQHTNYAEKFKVQLKIIDAADVFIKADHDRMLQVLNNLLSNAIKFSPPNSVVEVSMKVEDKKVVVSVIDYGAGIPEKFRPKMFERFSQADSSSTRHKGGTGLGLSICKAILIKHNSDLEFITEVNKGSTFYFALDLAENEQVVPSQENSKLSL